MLHVLTFLILSMISFIVVFKHFLLILFYLIALFIVLVSFLSLFTLIHQDLSWPKIRYFSFLLQTFLCCFFHHHHWIAYFSKWTLLGLDLQLLHYHHLFLSSYLFSHLVPVRDLKSIHL